MAQPHISPINVRCSFGKSAFRAIGVLIPAQFLQIFLLITMDNFHFCSFLPALCRTQSTAINGAGTTSSYGLFRPVTTNGRKVRVGRSNPARQKAGYVYFIESLLLASLMGLLLVFYPNCFPVIFWDISSINCFATIGAISISSDFITDFSDFYDSSAFHAIAPYIVHSIPSSISISSALSGQGNPKSLLLILHLGSPSFQNTMPSML